MNNENNKKNNKIIKSLILLFLSFLILIICFLSYKIIQNTKLKTRTIMIYMVGSNLESDAGLGTADLDSIKYDQMDNKNVKVVVIAGGSENWNNDYISKDETSIYELKEEGYVKVKQNQLLNMGDDKIFSDFLNFVYNNYKSDEYDLILWNHGGAIHGSEYDDLSNDYLSLTEMKKGLTNSKFNKNNKLELIMFETCLNGTLEVGNMISDYADYLVASEEITIGTSYTSVLDFINNIELKDNGYDVGLKFIDSYKNQIKEYIEVYSFSSNESVSLYSTYSIVKLSNIDNLVKSVNEFVNDIDITSNYNEVARVRSNLYQYAYTQGNDSSYDMVDLYNLVYNLKDLSSNKANKVLKEFDKTVLYNWATNDDSRGISIYFPYNADVKTKSSFLNIYEDFNELTDYKLFISKFNQIQNSATKNYSFSKNKSTITKKDNESDFTLELTEEQLKGFAKAEYLVFEKINNNEYRPIYKGKNVTLNENKLSANIKGKLLKTTDKKDKNSDYVLYLNEIDEDKDYIKYNTVGILTKIPKINDEDFFNKYEISSVNINLIRNKKTDDVNISSIIKLEDEDTLKSSSIALDIKNYTSISFGSTGWKIANEDGSYNENFENNGSFEGMEYKIENLEFKIEDFQENKDYYCVFRIYDVNNNYYYSKLLKMN